jgi:hypothetical protein
VIDVLMKADMDIFLASAMGKIAQIDARIAEDSSWLDAPFSRVRPKPEKDWPNDWAPALWFAAMNGRVDLARHLLSKGASVEINDPSGRSIADYAEKAGHPEIADLLRSADSGNK